MSLGTIKIHCILWVNEEFVANEIEVEYVQKLYEIVGRSDAKMTHVFVIFEKKVNMISYYISGLKPTMYLFKLGWTSLEWNGLLHGSKICKKMMLFFPFVNFFLVLKIHIKTFTEWFGGMNFGNCILRVKD